MNMATKIDLEIRDLKNKINRALSKGDALTDEERAEVSKWTDRVVAAEAEYRAAKVAETEGGDDMAKAKASEDAKKAATANANGNGNEAEKLRALYDGAQVSQIIAAALGGKQTTGQTAELQKELRLDFNHIPLGLIGIGEGPMALEFRAVTPAPSVVGAVQQTIEPGVFPMGGVAPFLSIQQPRVAVGESVWPTLTGNANVGTPAKGAAQAETTGSFSSEKLGPERIQAEFFYGIEDRASFAGLDPALRQNLSMAVIDKLDKEILQGVEGALTGSNLADNASTAEASWESYRKELVFGRVDGIYASAANEVKVVVGPATYEHMSAQFRTGTTDSVSALMAVMAASGGVRVSAHVPAVDQKKQLALVRRGMRRDMVQPIWEGAEIIEDRYSKLDKGQVRLVICLLYNQKILRSDGFHKQQLQVVT